MEYKGLEIVEFKNSDEMEKWLELNHDKVKGIWIRVYKKGSLIPSITREEFVINGLCWGWIDGLINSYDEISYLQRFTPRGKKSLWSKINVEYVNQLIIEGRMKPGGMYHVEQAKIDGRWDKAYLPPSQMKVPEEFNVLISKKPYALEQFNKLNKQEQYSIAFKFATSSQNNLQKKIIDIKLLA